MPLVGGWRPAPGHPSPSETRRPGDGGEAGQPGPAGDVSRADGRGSSDRLHKGTREAGRDGHPSLGAVAAVRLQGVWAVVHLPAARQHRAVSCTPTLAGV